MTLFRDTTDSPLGALTLLASDDAIVGLYLPRHKGLDPATLSSARVTPDHPVLRAAQDELAGYFAGTRMNFAVPIRLRGTDFQCAVWAALLGVPYGETRTYAELAAQLGQPLSVRAVGGANARNPISILVPCHRVVGADGALRGYAGGEASKRWLLRHEQSVLRLSLPDTPSQPPTPPGPPVPPRRPVSASVARAL